MSDSFINKNRSTLIILGVSLVIALLVGYLVFHYSSQFFKTTPLINMENTLPLAPDTGSASTTATPSSGQTGPFEPQSAGVAVPISADGTIPTWDGTSPVTILIMGLDYRDWQTGTDVPRTDTMILFQINPLTKTAAMLSIPRDLWVNIPGFGYSRINAAYRTGEMYKLPGGGMELAMKTVEQFIGVPVNYAALIDFYSFVKFIDTLGGLDMKIRTPLKIDPIGPGNTRTLEPGTQTLDGQAVLAYARNRYTQDGDFDRSTRQQEVIMALRNQIVNFNQLPMLVSKAPQLYQDMSSGIRTNLTLDQIIRLASLATQIDAKNIKKGVFDPHKDVSYATVMTSDGQADVLVPNPDQIRILRDQIFASGTAYAPSAITSDIVQLMKSEQAKVLIKDATGKDGLAQQAADYLTGQGMQVTGVEPAGTVSGVTTLVDHTGKPYTSQMLITKLNVPNATVQFKLDTNASVDLELMLGADYTAPQQ